MLRTIWNIAGRGRYGWLAIAMTATLVTWFYGFWKGPTTGLIFLPVGILVFFAAVGVLAMPLISSVLIVVAALTVADEGAEPALVLAAKVFLGVGLASFAWQFWNQKRRH